MVRAQTCARASLHTVMNAQFEELDPLLERFDLDDLVRFRRNLQHSIELQFELQFAEQEAQEATATATPASSEPPMGASGSGCQDGPVRPPEQQPVAAQTAAGKAEATAKRAGAPVAKAPTLAAACDGEAEEHVRAAQGVRQG